MTECWLLQQKKKPDALVHSVQEPLGVFRTILEKKPLGTVPDSELSDVRSERKPQDAGPDSIYLRFVSDGLVSLTADGVAVPVKILRDIGINQSLLLEGVLLLAKQSSAGASVLVQGVELSVLKVPLHKVYLRSNLVSGVVTVGVRPTLPIQGITFNNLAGGKVDLHPKLQVVDVPEQPKPQESLEKEPTDIYPACVVTRSAACKTRGSKRVMTSDVSNTQAESLDMVTTDVQPRKEVERVPEVAQSSPLSTEQLIVDQKNDSELCKLAEEAFGSEEESDVGRCYYCSDGILMRKWRPSTAPANEE